MHYFRKKIKQSVKYHSNSHNCRFSKSGPLRGQKACYSSISPAGLIVLISKYLGIYKKLKIAKNIFRICICIYTYMHFFNIFWIQIGGVRTQNKKNIENYILEESMWPKLICWNIHMFRS